MEPQFKRDNYFEVSQNGEKKKVILLNSVEKDVIFKEGNPKEIKNEVLENNSLKAFKLLNGAVLVIRDGEDEFPLYPSQEVLFTQLGIKNNSLVKEILDGVNIYDESFLVKSDSIANDFFKKFKINVKDKSAIQIINEVDQLISTHRNRVFFNENYLALIAIIGNLVNNEYNSSWVMIKNNKSNIWSPKIRFRGIDVFFADYIEIDFFNENEPRPLLQSYQSVCGILKFNSKE